MPVLEALFSILRLVHSLSARAIQSLLSMKLRLILPITKRFREQTVNSIQRNPNKMQNSYTIITMRQNSEVLEVCTR